MKNDEIISRNLTLSFSLLKEKHKLCNKEKVNRSGTLFPEGVLANPINDY